MVSETIRGGIRSEKVTVANVTATTFAIINMCEGVTAWVRRDGPLTSADVQNLSADLALRLVGATVGGAGNTGSARALEDGVSR